MNMISWYECNKLWGKDRCIIMGDLRWFSRASYYYVMMLCSHIMLGCDEGAFSL